MSSKVNKNGISVYVEKPKVKQKKKHVSMMPKHINPRFKFEVGDTVRAMEQSHGWGVISKGDSGVVSKVFHNGVEVDFQNRKSWFGTFRCFALVKKNKGVVANG